MVAFNAPYDELEGRHGINAGTINRDETVQ
jgi:hypothetical protein